jgi:hypothetical protein
MQPFHIDSFIFVICEKEVEMLKNSEKEKLLFLGHLFVENCPKFESNRRTRSWQTPLIIIPIALRLAQMKFVYTECRYYIAESFRKQMKVFRLN